MITIERINDSGSIYQTMKECDDAFEKSILNRSDFAQLYEKICNHAVFLKAESAGETAGFSAMYANNRETAAAYITLICVKENFRKQHIGASLLKKCEDIARQNGMRTIRLEVRNANTGAVAFYKKSGFITEKKCSDLSIYMIKEL